MLLDEQKQTDEGTSFSPFWGHVNLESHSTSTHESINKKKTKITQLYIIRLVVWVGEGGRGGQLKLEHKNL